MWMLPEDEDVFGARVLESFPHATWLCSKPGPIELHPVHLHPTINAAMSCDGGGVQAFLGLPVGATHPDTVGIADGVEPPTGPPLAASVQLLRSRTRRYKGVEVFEVGRLATSWYEHEVAAELLVSQCRRIWSALTAATRPASVTTPEGYRPNGRRIGPAAEAFALESGMPLADPGSWQLALIPRGRAPKESAPH